MSDCPDKSSSVTVDLSVVEIEQLGNWMSACSTPILSLNEAVRKILQIHLTKENEVEYLKDRFALPEQNKSGNPDNSPSDLGVQNRNISWGDIVTIAYYSAEADSQGKFQILFDPKDGPILLQKSEKEKPTVSK